MGLVGLVAGPSKESGLCVICACAFVSCYRVSVHIHMHSHCPQSIVRIICVLSIFVGLEQEQEGKG